MTASQKKIEFFEDSQDELYERIELIEEKLETIIKLLEDINNLEVNLVMIKVVMAIIITSMPIQHIGKVSRILISRHGYMFIIYLNYM